MEEKTYKMQSVSFKNVDEFLAYLPKDELKIVEFLRNNVLECIPGCREKLSYNVPYYSKHYGICFIWPASVAWGSKITYKGVRLGFANGYLLSDESNYLDKGDRKQVYWKDFADIKEIDVALIKSFLYEAALIDEEKGKMKKKIKKKAV